MRTHRNSIGLVALFLAAAIAGEALAQEIGKDEVKFSKKKLFVSPYESCAVADLNKDGKLDIIYGSYWFAGPDFLPHTFRANHTSADYVRCNSDHIWDVDGDGWLDIVTGGWNEDGIVWYKNPGKSAEEQKKPWEMHNPWKATTLTKTGGNMEMFLMHDYDKDGVPEIHGACYRRERPLSIWKFTKAEDGSPALKEFVLGKEGGGHGIAFGDVNGDGLEDTLTEIGWYERPKGDIYAQPWKLHRETDLSKMHPSCPYTVKDLNQDGRLDIVFGRGHNVGLFWWEQTEPKADGTTTWKQHEIDMSWSQAHCIGWADMDGDGKEDLIAGKCIWAHNGGDPGAAEPPSVYYYTWDPSNLKFTRHTIAEKGEMIALGRQFAVADLNGDGRNDLVAPSKIGLWLLMNEGKK